MFEHLTTESRNPESERLDSLTSREIAELISREDARVPAAVAAETERIAQAIDVVTDRLQRGGRLIYIGAGTSGRLGVLDAVECPPTFNSDPTQVVGVIAGGYQALTRAVEGAEDLPALGVDDLKALAVSAADVVVGIATSGRTPYVIGALEYARSRGAFAIGLTCNRDAELNAYADLTISPIVGPEVLSGSTRMKAGTATKMVLNMLTTGVMIRLGKTFGNLMVDLRATNSKLVDRATRIVRALTKLPNPEAEALLLACDGEVKTAITVHHTGHSPDEARRMLRSAGGHLRSALNGRISESTSAGP